MTKSADQTAHLRRLVCSIVVRNQQNHVFTHRASYDVEAQASWPPPGYAPGSKDHEPMEQSDLGPFVCNIIRLPKNIGRRGSMSAHNKSRDWWVFCSRISHLVLHLHNEKTRLVPKKGQREAGKSQMRCQKLMRGSRKFCQRGSNSDVVFFVFFLADEGREDPNSTKNGPSSAHQQIAI